MSYTRVDLPGGRWVAIVRDEATGAYGGTVWTTSDDGRDYADGATAGFPVSTETPLALVAEQLVRIVDAENA
jgi:hypothetical protein